MKISEHRLHLIVGELGYRRHRLTYLLNLFGAHVAHDLCGGFLADTQ